MSPHRLDNTTSPCREVQRNRDTHKQKTEKHALAISNCMSNLPEPAAVCGAECGEPTRRDTKFILVRCNMDQGPVKPGVLVGILGAALLVQCLYLDVECQSVVPPMGSGAFAPAAGRRMLKIFASNSWR